MQDVQGLFSHSELSLFIHVGKQSSLSKAKQHHLLNLKIFHYKNNSTDVAI